jgi:predicted transcriptional regulator
MKRSRDIIVSQILDVCRDGANKTKIVYKVNLNFRTINPYLELLTKNGMIRATEKKPLIYETTSRGVDVLNHFKYIQREFSDY